MKIISWNCNGALRNKLKQVDDLCADILVIQECENPEFADAHYRQWAGNYLWIGETKNRGIGIFPKNDHAVKKLDWVGQFNLTGLSSIGSALTWHTKDLRLFLPFTVDNYNLNLLAVWTKGRNDEVFGYVGQFWKYLQIHRTDLCHKNTCVLGDFNSNAIWDKPDRWWNHSDVVAELEEMNFYSLYHLQSGEAQGKETKPTFFLHRKREKQYHIDYVFISSDLVKNSFLDVKNYEDWIEYSDHVPMIINLTER